MSVLDAFGGVLCVHCRGRMRGSDYEVVRVQGIGYEVHRRCVDAWRIKRRVSV